MCVDHLIKKRTAGNLNLGKFIDKIRKDKNSETNTGESNLKQTNKTASKQNQNLGKISRNNNLQSKTTPPST